MQLIIVIGVLVVLAGIDGISCDANPNGTFEVSDASEIGLMNRAILVSGTF